MRGRPPTEAGPFRIQITEWSGRRGSNSRPLPWQGTLPILYSKEVEIGLLATTHPQFPRGSTLTTRASTLVTNEGRRRAEGYAAPDRNAQSLRQAFMRGIEDPGRRWWREPPALCCVVKARYGGVRRGPTMSFGASVRLHWKETANPTRGVTMIDLQPAADTVARIVGGVRDDQLTAPTPCTE